MQMSSQKSNKVLLPAAAMVVGLMAFRTHVPTFEARLTPKRTELAQLNGAIAKMRALDPAQVDQIRSSLEAERATVAAGEAQIPMSIETGPLLVRLDQGAKTHGLSAGTIVPVEGGSAGGLGVPAAAIAPYQGVAYTVNLHGPWSGIAAMLRDWQSAEPMALPIIHSVKSEQRTGALVAEVVFTIVTRPPSPATPAASVAGPAAGMPPAPPTPAIGSPARGVPAPVPAPSRSAAAPPVVTVTQGHAQSGMTPPR